jgi:exoribonuclease II
MYVLFEEAGKFAGGRILSETDASAQIELDSGKRVKAKTAQMLLRFERPTPANLMAEAQAAASDIELSLAWEFAPEDEFGFADLAAEYFSANASVVQQAACLWALHEAPHYFRRAGKGRYRKASADVLAQALVAIERKKEQMALIAQWVVDLAQGQCPAPIREQLYRILFKPDKNAPEYKAVVDAARQTQKGVLALLQDAGAIDSPYQFHWRRFLLEQFPKGTGFGAALDAGLDAAAEQRISAQIAALPLADCQAFSIDDSSTTEIDDALSVRGLGTGVVTLGIHIAAPGLGLQPGDVVDRVARERLSTVYMPGHKITMLPDAVVQRFTLQAGKACAALSLYLQIDEANFEIKTSTTLLERVPIAANLRHDKLDALVTEAWLASAQSSGESSGTDGSTAVSATPATLTAPDTLALDAADLWGGQPALRFLHRLAQHTKAQREVVRGKPEIFNRPDYNFKLMGVHGNEPQGDETVQISLRQRGAPLDLMVAEAMILANSTWGQWLATLGVPGIYRSQASLLPGVKVRMGTKALPHAGIGVPSYAWSTSPLRRYVDLVNQWQLIACVNHGNTAALVAAFKPKDAALFAIISGFDAAYATYNEFQNGMERFWTLRHLQQASVTHFAATVVRDNVQPVLVRADGVPLMTPLNAAAILRKGDQVLARVERIDLLSLEIVSSFVELREPTPPSAGDDMSAFQAPDDDEELNLGQVSLAISLDETSAPADSGAKL